MTEIYSCGLSPEEEEEMKHFFTTYDVNENGMLELDELQKMFANFNVIALREDIEALIEKVTFLTLISFSNPAQYINLKVLVVSNRLALLRLIT